MLAWLWLRMGRAQAEKWRVWGPRHALGAAVNARRVARELNSSEARAGRGTENEHCRRLPVTSAELPGTLELSTVRAGGRHIALPG